MIRVAIAGCGRLAELGYLPALERAGGVELAALIDPSAERLDAIAASRPNVGAYGDLVEAISEAAPDLVICCTPPSRHLEIARIATEAGIPALVEKPPAADLGDALELAALSPAPWIGFNRRFDQGIVLAPCVPDAGRVEMSLALSYRRAAWAPHETADDALLDLGGHLVDLALYLTGSRPLSVRAASLRPARARFELETSRGRVAIRCAQDRPHAELVELRDGRGRLLGRARRGWARTLRGRLARRPEPLSESLCRQLLAAARTIRGEGPEAPLASTADGIVVMRVLEAARRSAAVGGAEVVVEGVWPAPAQPQAHAGAPR